MLVVVVIKMVLMLGEYLFFLSLPLFLLVLASLFLKDFLLVNWLLVVCELSRALLCDVVGTTELVIIAQEIQVLRR